MRILIRLIAALVLASLALPAAARAAYRGRRIGFVPQNPAMGLAPHLRIGSQLVEIALQHADA